jgi:DNA replication protein DnaC
MNKDHKEEIGRCLKELRLSAARQHYSDIAEKCRAEGTSYELYLLNVIRQECDIRRERRIGRYLHESRLPLEKTLESFDLKRLPPEAMRQVKTLLGAEFINHKENLLVFGNPGSGKTHLVCGLAQGLIRCDKRVYFTTCALLLQHLLKAKKELKLDRLLKSLGHFDALIIDDIGYVQQEKEEMEVLFTLLADRYERGSVIITSNLPFSKWNNIFKDPMMTAAAVDRIVHHSVILELNIDSYRIDSAKKSKIVASHKSSKS